MSELFKIVVTDRHTGAKTHFYHWGSWSLDTLLYELEDDYRLDFVVVDVQHYKGKTRGWRSIDKLYFNCSQEDCPDCHYNPCTIETTDTCYKAAEDEWR